MGLKSVAQAQNNIAIRAPWLRWFVRYRELILLQLLFMAILLPVAAQTALAVIAVGALFFVRGRSVWRWPLQLQMDASAALFLQRLGQCFILFSLIQLALAASEIISNAGSLAAAGKIFYVHVRLLIKTAVYGYFIVPAILELAARAQAKGLQPSRYVIKSLLVFTSIYFLYMLGQRYWAWDIIHGLSARLEDDRFAYDVYRASGFMGHPLTLAYNATCFTLLCFAQGLYLLRRHEPAANLWFLQSALLFGVVLITGSRFPAASAAFFMVLAGFLYLRQQSFRISLRTWLGIAVFFVAAFAFLVLDPNLRGRMTEIFQGSMALEERFDRLIFWKVHAAMGSEHPLLGGGIIAYREALFDYYNRLGYANFARKYNAHNMYFQVFAEFGSLGVASLLLWLGGIYRCARQIWQDKAHMGLLIVVLFTIFGATMQNTLRDSEYLFGLWFLMALNLLLTQDQTLVSPSQDPVIIPVKDDHVTAK